MLQGKIHWDAIIAFWLAIAGAMAPTVPVLLPDFARSIPFVAGYTHGLRVLTTFDEQDGKGTPIGLLRPGTVGYAEIRETLQRIDPTLPLYPGMCQAL